MSWPEVSIEDFPPERDDETASLRQDILDELTDHFVCALNRELLKNPDEQLARQRVVNQFGDPIKIARQLWFDAMKEKMMSQRMMTGFSAVMAVCSIAVVGIAWSLMQESQNVNQKMLAQLALFADQPQAAETAKVNQQILKQLDELKQVQRGQAITDSGEMSQVSFQLVQDGNDKNPAVGFTGKLTKSGNQTDKFSVEAISNREGKIEFGKLPWGEYELNLRAPWGEYTNKGGSAAIGEPDSRRNLTVIPGRGYSQTIVCPTAQKSVPIQFKVNWTDKFRSEDWVLICDFRDRTLPGGQLEFPRKIDDAYWLSDQQLYVIEGQPSVYLIDKNNKVRVCPVDQQGKFKDLAPDLLIVDSSINMIERIDYSLSVIYLIPKQDLKKLSALNTPKSYQVIEFKNNKAQTISFNPTKNIPPSPFSSFGGGVGPYIHSTPILLPFKMITADPGVDESISGGLPLLTNTTNGVLLPKMLYYSALKNSPNVWEINLPDLNAIPVKSDSLKKNK